MSKQPDVLVFLSCRRSFFLSSSSSSLGRRLKAIPSRHIVNRQSHHPINNAAQNVWPTGSLKKLTRGNATRSALSAPWLHGPASIPTSAESDQSRGLRPAVNSLNALHKPGLMPGFRQIDPFSYPLGQLVLSGPFFLALRL